MTDDSTSAHGQRLQAAQLAAFRLTGWTVEPTKGCFLWNGHTGPKGYGVVFAAGTRKLAHRLALELSLGRPIRLGMLSIHSCDTPGCVNPSHLREGTYADNAQDRLERGSYFGATRWRCARGHEFSPENTRVVVARDGKHRRCRECERLRDRRRYDLARAKA